MQTHLPSAAMADTLRTYEERAMEGESGTVMCTGLTFKSVSLSEVQCRNIANFIVGCGASFADMVIKGVQFESNRALANLLRGVQRATSLYRLHFNATPLHDEHVIHIAYMVSILNIKLLSMKYAGLSDAGVRVLLAGIKKARGRLTLLDLTGNEGLARKTIAALLQNDAQIEDLTLARCAIPSRYFESGRLRSAVVATTGFNSLDLKRNYLSATAVSLLVEHIGAAYDANGLAVVIGGLVLTDNECDDMTAERVIRMMSSSFPAITTVVVSDAQTWMDAAQNLLIHAQETPGYVGPTPAEIVRATRHIQMVDGA